MKTLKTVAFGLLLSISGLMQAQVSVNVNIGSPPAWGPVGYPEVEYYYLPDIQSYYDVRTTEFIYYGNGTWVREHRLPPAYRRYDLYNGYKVVLTDYRGRAPYTFYKTHKVKYHKGYRGAPQQMIGVRKVKDHGHDRGHGNGHGKGHGKGHQKH